MIRPFFFHILGHDYLTHEVAVCQLNDARIGNGGALSDKSIFLFSKDCCEGLRDLRLNSGRQIINDIWENRILSIEHSALTTGSMHIDSTITHANLGEAIAMRDKWKKIKSELFFLVDFLLVHSSTGSFDGFIRENNLDFLESILAGRKTEASEVYPDVSLEYLFRNIKINSSKDVNSPEFPPAPFYEPTFPASATFKIFVPGFSDVWVKDESTNPTGSHKDRMALEIVVQYKALLETMKFHRRVGIPGLSIISSGSAALSIQHMLNLYRIPTRLRVLYDVRLDDSIVRNMENCGCLLFPCDLSGAQLSSEEIKFKTDNVDGIDLTHRDR